MGEVGIRRGASGDLPELTELYNHYVRETAITFDVEPFTLGTRRPWLEQFAGAGRHQLFVAEREGRVLGYACTGSFRPKAAYLPSVETSVYLRPEEHGRGLGTRLYAVLFEALGGEDVHRAYAGITPTRRRSRSTRASASASAGRSARWGGSSIGGGTCCGWRRRWGRGESRRSAHSCARKRETRLRRMPGCASGSSITAARTPVATRKRGEPKSRSVEPSRE